MKGIVIATILVCILGVCSLSDKDKDRVVEVAIEVGATCVHLDYNSEEWRDCMMDESRRIAGNTVKEIIEEEIE